MTAGEEPPLAKPLPNDEAVQIPQETHRLFADVAHGIDKNQTVIWKHAVTSLQAVNQYLDTAKEARTFMERYMFNIISILVEQRPATTGQMERSCVEQSLELAACIIAKDLRIQIVGDKDGPGECKVLNVLAEMFNKKKTYYKGAKSNWSTNMTNGLPEVRMRMIEKFRLERGFWYLAEYMSKRINTPQFPALELLHPILIAVDDALPTPAAADADRKMVSSDTMEKDAIFLAKAVIGYLSSLSEEQLKKLPHEMIDAIRDDLHDIFDCMLVAQREETYGFYEFWRAMTLKLITSQSLPLKLFGWDQANYLIGASADQRPPARSYHASGAGCTFANGEYQFCGSVTPDGYATPLTEISYVRKIPETEKEGGGKTFTLFRCTMRSQQKWWFLSEADEEQPGTDRDIDYYQHKSKSNNEREPPADGWITCRTAGIDPPPKLRGEGLMVPPGEEYNTLEHQLARWATENGIVELVLGDSLHREIVARSTDLLKFLASMCERDEPIEGFEGTMKPNTYCLQDSHLLLAWKTCTSKADAAVSAQIYQLLVSILPSLSSGMAITLLSAVQMSLQGSTEKRDYLPEVAEFCSALAASVPVDKAGQTLGLEGISDDVRKEILHLMWSLLTHPDASSLKGYDQLKRYVANELRLEPTGTVHRQYFLQSCTERLSQNANRKPGSGAVDELHVLRAVKLTQFVLQACPVQQRAAFVTEREGALPSLFFNELIAYMGRRNADLTMSPAQKRTGAGEVKHDVFAALSERLDILRYVYGISEEVKMNSAQLQHLWQLCSIPSDREALMIFIADASGSEASPTAPVLALVEPQPVHLQLNKSQLIAGRDPPVAAAFPDNVRNAAFLDLFCSTSVNWGELGEGSYRSFQSMFKKLRQSPEAAMATSAPSLDALWRICLNAGNDAVASEAMNDLLAVYNAMASTSQSQNAWADERMSPIGSDTMTIDAGEDSFGSRVFQCLVEVQKGLKAGTASSERSAERCLRILNAAVNHEGSSGRSLSSSALDALSSVASVADFPVALASLPHGMRGQSCYRRIGVMAKRTSSGNSNLTGQAVSTLTSLSTTPGKENISATGSKPTLRFTLYVHPLETLASIKKKVAEYCECPVTSVKAISVSGRLARTGSRAQGNDSTQLSLNVVAENSIVDQLGLVHGCELIVVIADLQAPATNSIASTKKPADSVSTLNVSEIFTGGSDFADRLFETLLGVLELLPWRETEENGSQAIDSHKLVWELLLAIPTNHGIVEKVQETAMAVGGRGNDAMVLDSPQERWFDLLDRTSFHHSVYVMQVIESFLQPAPEALAIVSPHTRVDCINALIRDAASFRSAFVQSGGFDAVVRWFSAPANGRTQKQSERRMGNAVALRILKCCLFGSSTPVISADTVSASSLDEAGRQLLQSLSEARGLLTSLTAMVVCDDGIASATILDVLRFLWLLVDSPSSTKEFVTLSDSLAENFLITLILWEGGPDSYRTNAMFGNATKIRKEAHDLIMKNPLLAKHALPWLIGAMDDIDVKSDATVEYFDELRHLVEATDDEENKTSASGADLQALGTAVCKKLLSCPRPTNDSALIDFSTGVLCGCLRLLRAIVEAGGSHALKIGTDLLLNDLKIARWSEQSGPTSTGVLQRVSSSFRARPRPNDVTLIDLMGAIFDGFLSPGGSSSVVAICCDKESRSLGFDAVATAARSCQGHDGYVALVHRINGIVKSAEPHLRHRWNQNGGTNDGHSRSMRNTAKYSGLRNQGCTCYMNSFLQQMFMMPELRERICAAPLPASLRTSGGTFAKGAELVGKKISLQWESGISYDAMVEGFDAATGMHTIRYCLMPVATVGGGGHQQVLPEEIARMPPDLPEEFFLSEGRPGKETGVFEIVEANAPAAAGEGTSEKYVPDKRDNEPLKETEDESSSRHLLEEVQRTFIHLDEGSRGRCFDPRALVEACACLKLEFDVWQQNDASEFAMKLLDRMEIALKKWAPEEFRYLDHTFGLKQTKQKVCKECGLKTNREENLMNIDCQIRGKSDIHEALSTMCEVELMEGNNKVFCDHCKKNTDTVLKTAISALPDMLILSLKRFDLDYNTFETVKLNSRCEFGQTLNMKRYSLEGIEALEKAGLESEAADGTPMDTDEDGTGNVPVDPLSSLPDEDYEYRLVGVLVHAGVAQGGHYYSFIKDRTPGADADKWYRFDDEDVTPFDPSSIEDECFGGLVTKDPKWPNGQVQTTERFANALMLFYEKVKPAKKPEEDSEELEKANDAIVEKTTGYDVFTPDVRQSNATHRWQTFLFDAEFQAFLKGLLGLCERSCAGKDVLETTSMRHINDSSWQGNILDMLISFFFDVLLYSAQKASVNDWVEMLSSIFMNDGETAKRFVRSLAERTRTTSSNWLRTYLTDCPEQEARIAAIRVFMKGIQACAAYTDEQDSLRQWAVAWKSQVQDIPYGQALPTRLEGRWQELESFTSSKVSIIGVILSYLTCLLEVAPRTWRYNADLCLLIRDLGNVRPEYGGFFLREGMEAAEFPARLICLVLRERSPSSLRAAFPGVTTSLAAAESQTRPETNPSAHILPMGSSQLVGAPERTSRNLPATQPNSSDYLTLFEAVGCLLGVKGVVHAPLLLEANETSGGRQRYVLSSQLEDALSTVFEESCSSPEGMSQRDIEIYMQHCGHDRSAISTQKIAEIISKYTPSTESIASKNGLLQREGFLAYYRDIAQTQDTRVRQELHTFGYRPDLSRRSRESRIVREHIRPSVDSVALDIAERANAYNPEDEPRSQYTMAALPSFHFFAHAFTASEPMAEHILVKCAFDWGDCIPELIVSSLRAVYRVACERWGGADQTWHAALMIFRTLSAISDEFQERRISMIMECDAKIHANNEYGIGLLIAPRDVQSATRHYNQDARYAYECYIKAIRSLAHSSQPVQRWLGENRAVWAWMARDVSRDDYSSRQHARVEYSRREDAHGASAIVDNYTHSDSDMINNDSDDDEDDYYDDGREHVVVSGAGLDVVNGQYMRTAVFDGVGKYSKYGVWQGLRHEFSLFRCNTSNNTKHWYISIVPHGVQPGTSTDIDFYSAPLSTGTPNFPPTDSWNTSSEGKAPAPTVAIMFDDVPNISPQPVRQIDTEIDETWGADSDFNNL